MSNYERFLSALNAIDSKLIVHRFYHYISWQKGFAVGEMRTRRCDIFKFGNAPLRFVSVIGKFSKARHNYSLIVSESFPGLQCRTTHCLIFLLLILHEGEL